MGDPTWSEAVQLHRATGLWYKFKQNYNGDWEVLCSGDKASIEKDSVTYHDHYWQSNGRWYFQGKRENKHIIGRDEFLESSQTIAEADAKAEVAYGSSGYNSRNRITGIEVSSFTDEGILNRFVREFQELSALTQAPTDETNPINSQLPSDESNPHQTHSGNHIFRDDSTVKSENTFKTTMTNSGTDSRVLLAGLIEYRNSLERHLGQLTSEYHQLEGRWRTFNSVSEGDYADQFRAGWRQTEARFKDYINQSQKIKAFLNERISALEALNRQESGLL
jgi:hypothetical protein